MASNVSFIGRGVVRPFRRDGKGDFVTADDAVNLSAAIGQIIGTRKGEMPWRTEFGSLVHLLKHAPNNETVRNELARKYVSDALSKWEPRIIVTRVTVTAVSTPAGPQREMLIRTFYNLVSSNSTTNAVLFPQDLEATISLPAAA